MQSTWNDVVKTLSSDYQDNYGIFDIHSDALGELEPNILDVPHGVPKILFRAPDTSAKEFTGKYNHDELLNFCLSHLDLKNILSSYRGGKTRKTRKSSQNMKKFVGVTRLKNGRFRATFARKHLGTFNTAKQAAAAYKKEHREDLLCCQ